MKVTDEKMLSALLAEGSIRSAAKSLRCSESTVRKRLENADFRQRYEALKSEILCEVCDKIQSRLITATDTLTSVMENQDNPATVRVSAADSLLRHGLRYIEIANIERRIIALEKAQKEENET